MKMVLVRLTFLAVIAGCSPKPTALSDMSTTLASIVGETQSPLIPAETQQIVLSDGFEAAVRAAVELSDSYRSALALEAAAMSQTRGASSSRRPQLSANVNVGGIRQYGSTSANDTVTGVSGTFTISQLIYDGGRTEALVGQATAEALVAQADRLRIANDLALEAALSWVDVWASANRLGELDVSIALLVPILEQVERLAESSLVDSAALDRAQLQVMNFELEKVTLEAEFRDATVRFERMFYTQPNSVPLPSDFVTSEVLADVVSDAYRVPGLARLAANILAARGAMMSAESEFRPRARLQAGINSPMQESDSTDTTLGVSVEYTLGDGGGRTSTLEAARDQLISAEAQLRDAQSSLQAELNAARARFASIDQSLSVVSEQIRLNAAEIETIRSQATTEQTNAADLLGAHIELYRSKNRQIELRAQRTTLLLTIASKTGYLGRSLGLSIEGS